MNRSRTDGRCPACGRTPKSSSTGVLSCACSNKLWERIAGVEATGAEADMLESHGFYFARSANGDAYYVGSYDRLVWLYADGAWAARPHPRSKDGTLEDYLNEIKTLSDLLGNGLST
jgi:hypothetical protein